MALGLTLAVLAATTTVTPPATGAATPPPPATAPAATPPPATTRYEPAGTADRPHGAGISQKVHDDWLLSVEAATRVPIDVGFQAGVQAPFGVRVFAGYGWVPAAFIDAASRTAGRGTLARAVLDSADYSGNLARVTLGIQPFRKIGVYLDGGYAHLWLRGSQGIPAFRFDSIEFPGGTYNAKSDLDLWLLELGYQANVGGRLVLAAAAGVTGAIDAHTSIVPSGSAPNDPALGNAAGQIDHALRTNVLPTLTLRVGFDLI
jgi:hypothetical protein